MTDQSCRAFIENIVVTTDQMRRVEGHLFDSGMPVPALMEKVAGLITAWISDHFDREDYPRVGILVGPGHNGGDALVVARELWFKGYEVAVCCPVDRQKPLTASHLAFIQSLGIPVGSDVSSLQAQDLIVDGLFGFGLERPLEGEVADLVNQINVLMQPVVSIDLPSGLHTDSGNVLGTALRATHTLCLGLWKKAFCQSHALPFLGHHHLIDFDIPEAAVNANLPTPYPVQRVTLATVKPRLPLPRNPDTYKYRVGHLLIVAGSRQFAGAALLTGLGAQASGVGMVTMVVPESLRWAVLSELPEALILGCPETESGAIAQLPGSLDLSQYNAVVCGPGLSRQAAGNVSEVIDPPTALVLDADGLNLLAEGNPLKTLSRRAHPTLLTPHPGEFKRLFPDIAGDYADAGNAAKTAAHQSNAVVLLKGACTTIASPNGCLWYINNSTPALARGGSGDILAGLAGGLLAQFMSAEETPVLDSSMDAAIVASWWHAQAANWAATYRTQLGVDGRTLAQALNPVLAEVLS
jgi:hydroxyethylthiazole kinase-like uncharacterized protein yjeF